MELIQIIESTVFFFSLGLLSLLILSYLLFKIKNRDVSFPLDKSNNSDQLRITYERPAEETHLNTERENNFKKRFIVVNEMMREERSSAAKSWREVNPRYYIYKPGRDKIVTNLQLSRIKD